jgi:hypothetical protein
LDELFALKPEVLDMIDTGEEEEEEEEAESKEEEEKEEVR